MPEHIQYEDDELFNPETHHEHTDVPVRPLWWAMIIFVIFAILSHIVLWYLYKAFVKGERNRAEAPQTAVSRPADISVPRDQPLLQPFPRVDESGEPLPPMHDTPVTDLVKMQRHETMILGSYGWVDRQNGVVRIPIEEAKAMLAARLAVQSQLGGTVPGAAEQDRAPGAAAPSQPMNDSSGGLTATPPASPTADDQQSTAQQTTTGGQP